MHPPDLPTAVLWGFLAVAASTDWSKRRIPNALVVVGLIIGVALKAQLGGLAGLGFALLGAGLALALLFPLWALGHALGRTVLGAGDVKLFTVCGAFLGWQPVLELVLVTALMNGVVSVGFLGARQLALARGRTLAEPRVPVAVSILPAAVVVGVAGPLLSLP